MEDQFSYVAMRQRLEGFAETIPDLLAGHPLTAKYAVGLHNLLDQVDSPFTVAVTGQMRVGKSTLLNALIGEDLAITGVNETTATINWFKHGGEELKGKFRVAWKSRPEELFALDKVSDWIGDSERAADTRYLEFFSSSDLLKQANFIDTPGTRSVIESHEDTINEFLARRCEKESMRQGGKADAIIYVFPAVARESDKARLGSFGECSRIPGSSPFNSIGVLHKWDHLDAEDLFEDVAGKAATVAESMKGLVAGVVPVSAPLFLAAERYDEAFWEKVVALASLENEEDFAELLVSDERDFVSETIDGCALTAEERAVFRTAHPLPWVSACLILKQVRRHAITDSDTAMVFIREKSGIPRLQLELEQRFFTKSRLIKILGCLNRAWDPCLQASIALRSEKTALATELDHIPEYLEYIESLAAEPQAVVQRLQGFMQRTHTVLRDRVGDNATLLSRLDKEREEASALRECLDDDLVCLEMLEGEEGSPCGPSLRNQLQGLFGYHGAELEDRCALFQEETGRPEDGLLNALDRIGQMDFYGKWRRVHRHALLRIGQILDVLEEGEGR